MGLFDAIRKNSNKPSPVHQPSGRTDSPEQALERQLIIPEIQPVDLIPRHREGQAPRLLDCREPFEWRQVRIPGSLHVPMNQIPARLPELDKNEEWVVVCAHGNRSYAVAGYLIQNGFKASSLAGGVTDWWMRGGETESDFR